MRKLYIMDAIIDGIEYSRNGININFGMTALLWIICLVLACFFLYKEAKNNHAAAVCLKGMASLCFVLLGLLGKKYSQDPSLAEKVFFGLCLGMIADILLNLRYVFPKIGQKIFLVGILVFLAGHVMYIAALIPKSRCLTFSLIAAVILTAVLIWWIFRRITAKPAFKIFGIFYLGAIMVMTCIAIGIMITDPSAFSVMFSLGALLFLASDIILILNTFGGPSQENLRIANILLYYVGQLLIAASLQII